MKQRPVIALLFRVWLGACLLVSTTGCSFFDLPHNIGAERRIKGMVATQTHLRVPQPYEFDGYVLPAGIYKPAYEQWNRIHYVAPVEITGKVGMFAMPRDVVGGISLPYDLSSGPRLYYSTFEETYGIPIPADFQYRLEALGKADPRETAPVIEMD